MPEDSKPVQEVVEAESVSTGEEDSDSSVEDCSAKNEEAVKAKPLHIVFDVVDSVKGGSGKSTISLQLAAFWRSNPKPNITTSAYIIDLDLRGTSWRNNHEFLLGSEETLGKKYISSQLMYDFSPRDSIFWNLKVNMDDEGAEYVNVPICICDPKSTEDITPVKSDLLESTVYKIIKEIIARATGSEEIHIIFDMPPSYEAHAERVFTHLLMDKDSELFRELQDAEKYSFNINLFMLFAISRAHLEQDTVYVQNLLKSPKYSSNLWPLIDKGQFLIYFIGNDVTEALKHSDRTRFEAINKIKEVFWPNSDEPSRDKYVIQQVGANPSQRLLKDISIIQHFEKAGNDSAYFLNSKEEESSPRLQLEAKQVFEEIFGIHDTK